MFVCCFSPHISAACLPDPNTEFAGSRCYTTGWGKDAFGDFGKYQNILKEVDVPVVSHHQCQSQLQQTRLGYDFKLHPGFVCAGGEEGKDACKVRFKPSPNNILISTSKFSQRIKLDKNSGFQQQSYYCE